MADLSSLIIRLAANTASLQSDLGRANAIAQRNAEQLTKIYQGAANLIGAAIGGIGVRAVVDFGKASIDAADQVAKLSQSVGLSTKALSTYKVAADLSGSSMEGLGTAVQRLSRAAVESTQGAETYARGFRAIGVSVTDTNGKLKSSQQIFEEVATALAGYQDGAGKTAVAQQLMGRSGAALIPLMNQLGTQGFAKAREEAEAYNQVIGEDQAHASERFNDNLTRLHMATTGFANAILQELLPTLNKYTDTMAEAAKTNDRYASSAHNVVEGIKVIIFSLQALGAVSKITTDLTYGVLKASAQAGKAFVENGAGAAAQKFKDLGSDIGGALSSLERGYNSLFGTFANVTAGAETTAKTGGKALDDFAATAKKSTGDATKATEAFNDALQKVGAHLAKMDGDLSPVAKAYADYTAAIIAANKESQDLIEKGKKAGESQRAFAAAQQLAARATSAANIELNKTLSSIDRQGDVLGRFNQEIADQSALVGLTDRQRAMADASQKAADEWERLNSLGISMKQTLDDVKVGAADTAGAFYDFTEQVKAQQEATRECQSIWQNAGRSISETIGNIVANGGSLLKQLSQIAKQVVAQIVSYFLQMRFIGPILQSIFGGGGGGYAQVAGSFLGGGTGGIAGGLVSSFSSGGEAASSNAGLFGTGGQGYSLFNAGKQIWSGFQSGYSSFFSGADAFTAGPPTPGGSTSSYYGGGYQSGFGQALGIAGGIYAGYNRYQSAGGGAAGVAGGAAYGVGTYYAGAALATTAATGSLAAGLAAIPVVGWIAIAAMAVDYLSGGKLFGTKGKLVGGGQQIDIGAGGVGIDQWYTTKGQRALFGGAYWKEHHMATDPAVQQAWDDFFSSVNQGISIYAKKYGIDGGGIIAASFQQNFDKHGNVTGSTTSIVGHEYKGETVEQFQTRVVAESVIALLDQVNTGLSDAVDKYRADADLIMQVSQTLLGVQDYLSQGGKLMALGSDQTVTSILKFAESVQGLNESITDTIQRLIQAQAQYDQFVGQFKPAPTYVDDFEGAISQINQQMLANIKTANDLAKAAGAAGASEKDLANIIQYAANQAAEALRQLQAAAQSNAFSLGLTNIGSLDQVNAEIARLQAKADAAKNPVRNFGDAMQTAAQRATDAMNLLLGSLSPYNDQRKLQIALQGLRAGTVTQDQVLEIGRRLYASSQAYTDLFNQVRQFGGRQTSPIAGGGAVGSGAEGLSASESKRLSDLLKLQEQLQASAQLQQYQLLAQQIAEIAAFKNEDWKNVIQGLDLDKFAKGLGLTADQLDEYIKKLEDQTDSNGENTRSIVDSMDRAADRIVAAIRGDPDPGAGSGHSTHGTGRGDGYGPPNLGHGGHSMNGRDIGREIARGFVEEVGARQPRNMRPTRG